MSTSSLVRWGWAASLIGGTSWLLIWLLFLRLHGPGPDDRKETMFGLTHYDISKFIVIPLLLFTIGLLSLHAGQRGRSGWLERAGLIIALSGLAAIIAGVVLSLWLIPWGSYTVDWEAPTHMYGGIFSALGTLVTSIGMIVFAVGALRARVWPRWIALPLILGSLTTIPWLHMTSYGWIAGCMWLLIGYALWSSARQQPAATASAT